MKKAECTGCGACCNICPNKCIIMKKSFDGCYYPAINHTDCIKCGKCKQICPIRNYNNQSEKEDYLNTYAGYAAEDRIREASSSGGIFSLAAEWFIAKDGWIFGAAYQNNKVIHTVGTCKEEVERLKGSKYVQSDIGYTYQEAETALKNGKYVLFTGLPCQIAGLKAYLGKEYEKLYTIDLICHGVGAPLIWDKYIKTFHHKKHIISINFKNKEHGWNHEQLVIKYENEKEYRKFPLEDCYTYGFNKNIFLRPSCYECKYKGTNRKSDLTIGDAWGVEHYAPRFRDDKGCSLIFIHSNKGREIFENIESRLNYVAVNAQKAIQFNQRMISSVDMNPEREMFYNDLRKYSFRYTMMRMMQREKHKEK